MTSRIYHNRPPQIIHPDVYILNNTIDKIVYTPIATSPCSSNDVEMKYYKCYCIILLLVAILSFIIIMV